MVRGSTVIAFALEIADVDRGVYASEDLRVAQHPSETPQSVVVRVLCYALELREGLAMGKGLCLPDEPALAARDLTGRITLWIDVGAPAADRLHKAAKAVDEVQVWSHKDPAKLRARWAAERTIHRAEAITLTALPPAFVDDVAARLARSNRWSVLRTEGRLYLTIAEDTLEADLTTGAIL